MHRQSRFFVVRARAIVNAKAWYWANCDISVGIIPNDRSRPGE
ncbi:DUF6555 family protein [Pseudomonas protegens]|nr:DUF6555 family protein [Pseudomonas protegens]